ncbi:MAG TPA: phosphopyruvate hydratase [Pirellulaceae bacterium]|nr:phosphopyruvate hydratase [Pirellulaceae bacterium]
MSLITRIHAREILDSRGKPTVEAEVHVSGGIVGRASVPSGASTGTAEVHELRDGDDSRYDGQGVLQAVHHIDKIIAPQLAGHSVLEQAKIDELMIELDGTPRKSRLGANAILAVSLASARAAALVRGIPLYRHLQSLLIDEASELPEAGSQGSNLFPIRMPLPMTNMISGGKHAGGNLDIQDVLVTPLGAPDYRTGLEWIVRVYRRLGKLLRDAGYEGYLVGDEGGYGPRLRSNREALEFVQRAIEAAGLKPGKDMYLTLDVASSHFYRNGAYHLAVDRGRGITSSQMIDILQQWTEQFPLWSIEDGLAEEDWDGWCELTQRLGEQVLLVGDDLFATNVVRLEKGIELKLANSVLIKVNQIGTLTETFRTMIRARLAGYELVVSARSGETEDDFLADLAVACGAEYIKIGSIARSERLAKYNRLLRIGEEI